MESVFCANPELTGEMSSACCTTCLYESWFRYDELSKLTMAQVRLSNSGIELVLERNVRMEAEATETTSCGGGLAGYVFCSIKCCTKGVRVLHHDPWSRKDLLQFLSNLCKSLGVGSSRARQYTGHSAKRGGVKLLRFLGFTDAFVMRWFKMTGQQAYLRYTEGSLMTAGDWKFL
eukprot:IDg4541t1